MQCYEGLKAFRAPGDESITIFRPSMNAERMQHSASFISIPEVPVEHFLKCCRLAVALNADFVPPHHTGAAMYVRPLLFGSSAQLGLNPPEEYTFLVYVLPTGVYHGTKPVKALILEEFDRAAPEGTGSAKVGGNYAPVLRWSEKAYKSGYGITLHLDSKTRTEIEEFSTSGFIGVKKEGDNITLVVPDSKRVIRSITSDSVQEIAKSLGWKVEIRPVCFSHFHAITTLIKQPQVLYPELASFSEVLAAGTAAALVSIASITLNSKSETFTYLTAEEPGPVAVKLLTTLKGIQVGKVKDTFGWNDVVPEAKGYTSAEATNGKATNGGIEAKSADAIDVL
jgi:branched-chain amino acid aminotransferase